MTFVLTPGGKMNLGMKSREVHEVFKDETYPLLTTRFLISRNTVEKHRVGDE